MSYVNCFILYWPLIIPALLYIMSSCPWLETAKSTALEMSDSLDTSQTTKVAFGPSSEAVSSPSCLCISVIMTLAPLLMNLAAVSLPMPLAAPVISATLPSSFLTFTKLFSASDNQLGDGLEKKQG